MAPDLPAPGQPPAGAPAPGQPPAGPSAPGAPPAAGGRRDGIRLVRVELLNWGTFDRRVAVLRLDGGSCLLTGDVGSGKSTVVDAVSVVLNPPSQVTFNLAAGAVRRERTLTSYVLGAYRNVTDEATGAARPDHLRRPAGTQSVVLAVFRDGAGRCVTAGVVLRFQNETSSPTPQYLFAEQDLSVERHFAGHADARGLRAALKAAGVVLFDQYRQYAKVLGRRLRLSRVALGLFNQTVSMKSVADLNRFVRTHMLEAADVTGAVDQMLAHYADLTRAHDLVVDARRQQEALDRVAAEAQRLVAAEERIAAADEAARAVPATVDGHRADLLAAAVAAAGAELPVLRARRQELGGRQAALRRQEADLAVALRSRGGADLALAGRDLDDARAREEAAAAARDELEALARDARVDPPAGASAFPGYLAALADAQGRLAADRDAGQQRLGAAVADVSRTRAALRDHDREAAAAGTRTSNIPTRLAGLRDDVAADLRLPPGALVFAGELLAVADEHAAWRGAVERLVRGFALALLVPARHHAAVTAWVDGRHLGQRLVTYRVDDPAARGGTGAGTAEPGTVASLLAVRPGAAAAGWVAAEVARRFDHRCVDDPGEMARHRRALTRAGQVKDSYRQEKDDRRQVGDRLGWVLGWDTRDRRAALEAARPGLGAAADAAERRMAAEKGAVDALTVRDRALAALAARFTDPVPVDVDAAREAVRAAAAHLEALRADPEIAGLDRLLRQVRRDLAALGAELERAVGAVATTEKDLGRHQAQLDALDAVRPPLSDAAEELLRRARGEAGAAPGDLSRVDGWERALRDRVEAHATSARMRRSAVEQALVAAMGAYASGWPARAVDVDTRSVHGSRELLELRARLVADDLPRFERDFREKLQSNAINEIAMFAHRLDLDAAAIEERIATINAALADVDYQPGTRIALVADRTKDPQVREFRAELRAITTGVVGAGDGTYGEARFLAVRELLDRFRGREGRTEEDARWVRRVTDVRNWHTFAATELSRDEGTLVEHYSDSDGKSGGQKEKLAYTILAASLAYQYGLAEGDARGFRFVMIDEAFGRGSEESTRYGLDLFGRLGLQLLVVTPLQKIATIEPYVQAVGYVGRTGAASRLRSMTVEEYRTLRAGHLAAGPAGTPPAAPPRPAGTPPPPEPPGAPGVPGAPGPPGGAP